MVQSLAVTRKIKLELVGGKANPAPPVGPALGAKVRLQQHYLVPWCIAGIRPCNRPVHWLSFDGLAAVQLLMYVSFWTQRVES